jgi:thymidylate synthase
MDLSASLHLFNKTINVIVEIHESGGLDTNHLQTDLAYFKNQTTQGSPYSNALIMGRKTYQTINKQLPNRHNYIVSTTITSINGCFVCKSLEDALLNAFHNKDVQTIWICGGKQIYEEFMLRYNPTSIYVVLNKNKSLSKSIFHTIMDTDLFFPPDYTIIKSHLDNLRSVHLLQQTPDDISSEESSYFSLGKNIIRNGFYQLDRTGVGTITQHGALLRFNLRNGLFPALTSRRVFIRGAIEEFLWMLRGETDITPLREKNIHIWDGNTSSDFISNRGLHGVVPEHNIGTLYGYQIRNWNGDWQKWLHHKERTGTDQLASLIHNLKNNPTSRRHIISNYNVTQLDLGVLEPCHTLYAFNVDTNTNELHSTLFMRSTDYCCGLVLNILHISFLTHLLCHMLGYKPGDFVYMGNNVHIYTNHIHQFLLQSFRKTSNFPSISFSKPISTISDIESLQYNDVLIHNYKPNKPLKYTMAI